MPDKSLPYKIAVLCYLFDEQGNVLLLHRKKQPNQDLYSPIGGKLEMADGESPTACAIREVFEETGLVITPGDLHLTGIISETGYENQSHWLMYLYELIHPANVTAGEMDEGVLEWHTQNTISQLSIPETDRYVIWPLFWRYRRHFFMAHIDCRDGLRWRVEQPADDTGPWQTNS